MLMHVVTFTFKAVHLDQLNRRIPKESRIFRRPNTIRAQCPTRYRPRKATNNVSYAWLPISRTKPTSSSISTTLSARS